jgi:hypothetical protein
MGSCVSSLPSSHSSISISERYNVGVGVGGVGKHRSGSTVGIAGAAAVNGSTSFGDHHNNGNGNGRPGRAGSDPVKRTTHYTTKSNNSNGAAATVATLTKTKPSGNNKAVAITASSRLAPIQRSRPSSDTETGPLSIRVYDSNNNGYGRNGGRRLSHHNSGPSSSSGTISPYPRGYGIGMNSTNISMMSSSDVMLSTPGMWVSPPPPTQPLLPTSVPSSPPHHQAHLAALQLTLSPTIMRVKNGSHHSHNLSQSGYHDGCSVTQSSTGQYSHVDDYGNVDISSDAPLTSDVIESPNVSSKSTNYSTDSAMSLPSLPISRRCAILSNTRQLMVDSSSASRDTMTIPNSSNNSIIMSNNMNLNPSDTYANNRSSYNGAMPRRRLSINHSVVSNTNSNDIINMSTSPHDGNAHGVAGHYFEDGYLPSLNRIVSPPQHSSSSSYGYAGCTDAYGNVISGHDSNDDMEASLLNDMGDIDSVNNSQIWQRQSMFVPPSEPQSPSILSTCNTRPNNNSNSNNSSATRASITHNFESPQSHAAAAVAGVAVAVPMTSRARHRSHTTPSPMVTILPNGSVALPLMTTPSSSSTTVNTTTPLLFSSSTATSLSSGTSARVHRFSQRQGFQLPPVSGRRATAGDVPLTSFLHTAAVASSSSSSSLSLSLNKRASLIITRGAQLPPTATAAVIVVSSSIMNGGKEKEAIATMSSNNSNSSNCNNGNDNATANGVVITSTSVAMLSSSPLISDASNKNTSNHHHSVSPSHFTWSREHVNRSAT